MKRAARKPNEVTPSLRGNPGTISTPGMPWSLTKGVQGVVEAEGRHAEEALAMAEEDTLKSDLTVAVQEGRLPTRHVVSTVDPVNHGGLADRCNKILGKVLPLQEF